MFSRDYLVPNCEVSLKKKKKKKTFLVGPAVGYKEGTTYIYCTSK